MKRFSYQTGNRVRKCVRRHSAGYTRRRSIMSKGAFLARHVAVLASIGLLALGQTALAADAVLETSALRLEVTAAPYSYTVFEKSTGAILVTESQTTFTVGTGNAATAASIVGQTASSIDATLVLAGTSDTAHVQWSIVNNDVIKVQLTYNNGVPTNIKEQFVDTGERNYGIWEFSYW